MGQSPNEGSGWGVIGWLVAAVMFFALACLSTSPPHFTSAGPNPLNSFFLVCSGLCFVTACIWVRG